MNCDSEQRGGRKRSEHKGRKDFVSHMMEIMFFRASAVADWEPGRYAGNRARIGNSTAQVSSESWKGEHGCGMLPIETFTLRGTTAAGSVHFGSARQKREVFDRPCVIPTEPGIIACHLCKCWGNNFLLLAPSAATSCHCKALPQTSAIRSPRFD